MDDQYALARENMIRTQLIPRGIRDPELLQVMRAIPRERFVPALLKKMAYTDGALAIGEGQTISQPYIVALMTEALALKDTDKALEIGTGSGYQAAVLAKLCESVYTVDRIKKLLERAEQILTKLGYTNIHFKVSNGTLGWREHAPYDAIIVTAGAPYIPDPLIEQLAEGGRLVIPVGNRIGQELIKITKKDGNLFEDDLGAVRFVNLIGEYGWNETSS
ncbi:MAG: protein-L-isoaspartate(D-aspartate) O-methyltransferase [Deltaproteobacteria bacterium]|nr:protein-L-isoaspartate(D-aspartate) O-methyltransferase [Deltaproteobacteria bacterium]